MDDPFLLEMLKSVAAPAFAGWILVLAIWRPQKKDAGPAPAWAVVCGVALAYGLGHVLSQGWHGFWPADTTRRLLHAAAAVGVVGSALALTGPPRFVRALVWLVLSAGLAWALAEHRLRTGVWEGAEALGWIAAWSLLMTGSGLSFEWFAGKGGGWSTGFGLSLLIGAGSFVVAQSGSASLGQSLGPLGMFAGAALVVGLLRKSFTLEGGGAAGLGVLYGCVMLLGYTLVPEPAPRVALGIAAAAPLVLGLVPACRWFARLPKAALVGVSVAVLAGLFAAAIADIEATKASESGDADLSELYGG